MNHFLLQCPRLHRERDHNLEKIKEYGEDVSGPETWIYITRDDFRMARFILDSSNFLDEIPALNLTKAAPSSATCQTSHQKLVL